MIYLFEAKLPETKSIFFGLKAIFGIGKNRSLLICRKLGFSPNLKIKELSDRQIYKISKLIEFLNFTISNDLKRVNLLNNQRLVNIKSYRGLRKKQGFPVRGQRTHTNAATAKRNRK